MSETNLDDVVDDFETPKERTRRKMYERKLKKKRDDRYQYLHPKTLDDTYVHFREAARDSSDLCTKDALVPMRDRISRKLPVIEGNLFDFDKKVHAENHYYRRQKLTEKLKAFHKAFPDQGRRKYWKSSDLFGAYTINKIQSKYPIPGSVVKDGQDRIEWRRKDLDRHETKVRRRKELHEESFRHDFHAMLDAQVSSTTCREIDRLLEANRKVNIRLTETYNEHELTSPKDRLNVDEISSRLKMLKLPYKHVDPSRFRSNVLSYSQHEQLRYLLEIQNAEIDTEDILTTKQLIRATTEHESESADARNMQVGRLLRTYGSYYRKANLSIQHAKQIARTKAKRLAKERKHQLCQATKKKKMLEAYRTRRGSTFLPSKPLKNEHFVL